MLTIILRVRPQKVCAHPTAHTCVGSLSYTLSPLIALRKLSKPSSCPLKCHIFKHKALENVSPKWSLLFSPYKYFGCEKSTRLAWVFFFTCKYFVSESTIWEFPVLAWDRTVYHCKIMADWRFLIQEHPRKTIYDLSCSRCQVEGKQGPHSSLRRFVQMHGAGRVLQSRLLPLRLALTTR